MVTHADFMHLFGNMVFLWVFGNAVCNKLGDVQYLAAYIFFGLMAALSFTLAQGGLMIGASGAINGVVGLFFVLFPFNEIACWYFLFFFFHIRTGSFQAYSIWMILLWLVFDIWGLVMSGGGVAYSAHLGGFAAGAGIGVVLLLSGLIQMERGEKSLVAFLKLQPETKRKQWIERNFTDDEPDGEPTKAFATGTARRPRRGFPKAPGTIRRTMPSPPKTSTPASKLAMPTISMTDEMPPEPILVACTCGKRMRVPGKFAEKRIRCPNCQNVIVVPGTLTS